MATLRNAIDAHIADLTAQIEAAKQLALVTIEPLQKQIYDEQAKYAMFAPFLDQEVEVARTRAVALAEAGIQASPKRI